MSLPQLLTANGAAAERVLLRPLSDAGKEKGGAGSA